VEAGRQNRSMESSSTQIRYRLTKKKRRRQSALGPIRFPFYEYWKERRWPVIATGLSIRSTLGCNFTTSLLTTGCSRDARHHPGDGVFGRWFLVYERDRELLRVVSSTRRRDHGRSSWVDNGSFMGGRAATAARKCLETIERSTLETPATSDASRSRLHGGVRIRL